MSAICCRLIVLVVITLLATAHGTIGAEPNPTKLDVQQSSAMIGAQNSGGGDQQICRPCACVSLPTSPVVAAVPPQVILPQAQQQQLLQCPPVAPCPLAMPMPMRPPRPLPKPPTFICPPPQQCPPPPVCPRPEPCPVSAPAPQVPLPPPPALPAFIAPPPQQGLRPPPLVPLIIGTQNDCCCNCVQTTCRATGIAGGRAHGTRTTSLGSAIWEELFGGGNAAPPPPPKLMAMEAKCNSRVLEEAILENMLTDLESSKRKIQSVAEQRMGAAVNVICGAYEFSFVVHTDQFCQAARHGMSCYAFISSSAPK